MKQNIIETTVGFIILAIALSFFVFAYNKGNKIEGSGGYLLKAEFQNIDGIVSGSYIMISGIKIGQVDKIELDKDTYVATAWLKIKDNLKLPKDSQASVSTSGLLGGKFIAITPGSSDEMLDPLAQIKYTQSSINIESLIGKLMYSITNK